MVVGNADAGIEMRAEVGVEGVTEGVAVGVAVDDAVVVDAGGVRPPQVQAPSVPRGI